MLKAHTRNLRREVEEYKKSQEIDPIKAVSDPIKTVSDPIKDRLLDAIRHDGSLTYAEYGSLMGVSPSTIKRRLNDMKKNGRISRMGSNKTGHWIINQ